MKVRYSVFIIIFTLIIFFPLIPVIAQAPDTIWTKKIGDRFAWPSEVQQTTDGGYIITGQGYPPHDYGNYQVLLFKTNSSGNTLWTKYIGGSNLDVGGTVQQTTDGGYILTGFTQSYGAGDRDFFLIKTNSSGDILWTKTYDRGGWESGRSGQQTTDGGYIIAGVITFAVKSDIWLIKTNSSGDTLWTKTFGGTGFEEGGSVQQTTDGGYIIGGTTQSYGAGGDDIWIIKTNSSGDTLWTKTFGGTSDDGIGSIQQTTDGGYIIAGGTSDQDGTWLIKTNSSGDTIWTKIIGEPSFGQQTIVGGYIIAGETSFGGDGDIWPIKTNSSGDTIWTKTFGGTGFEEGGSVQQTTDGGYIIGGATRSYGAGDFDIWIIKTNSSGDILWTKILDAPNDNTSGHIIQTSDGGYIMAAKTDPGDGRLIIWLIKLAPDDTTAVGLENLELQTDFVLNQNYPNPFNPSTKIKFALPKPENVKIEIYNIIGQKIETLLNTRMSAGNHKIELSGQNLSSGVYFYRIEAGEFQDVKKMILLQ